MLRNIDPILSPDLLFTLAEMGHGDEIVIADANFPAASMGQRVIRAEASNATDMLRAVLSLLPLDPYVPEPAVTMQVVGDPTAVPEAVAAFQQVVSDCADKPVRLGSVERFAFYDRARAAFAVVQTGERRLYGNIILTKGVIG
ncbi:RbsD/FucU domain-containing protein [Fluviibacterium sp. DFM31]|uniref:RbsD/FucU domain-containing protein n=1 Tax=Meridianimarinicoccus marinus TaxID=3231483 RepID=A0ABV3L774_9RHOB